MRLSVTTPCGSLVDTEVEEVTVPGALGELGILPGHIPLMSSLRPGVLVYRAHNRTGVVAVGEGFLQVSPVGGTDRVLVIVEKAEQANQISAKDAMAELARIEEQLAHWKQDLDDEYHALVAKRNWATAKADAAGRAKSDTVH